MNVCKALQQSRVDLLATPLKKSGKNTFAKYEYFELEDFLPDVQRIFHTHGLCGVMTFDTEMAKLTIYGEEGSLVFSAPMATAELKGCHSIQNMGAVISYMRRYLYMLALEICEHDELDATTGKEKPDQKTEQKHPANDDKPWFNDFDKMKPKFIESITTGERTAQEIIANLRNKFKVSKDMAEKIHALESA